ncbi:PIG-L deacetylase family protein [Micromonospora sp. NPDC049171]|uniref:PIG-L deacetylase family protein n=1 Tax=Micromonospora sp. NPDC049171 TaxID=3155770 RepID=UPI0033D9FC41
MADDIATTRWAGAASTSMAADDPVGGANPFATTALRTALVIVAHPDDEALLCGGTIARMTQAGMDVHVASLSRGSQGRDKAFDACCEILGATGEVGDLESNDLRIDGDLVTITDALIDARRPDVVITHGPGAGQNQDHNAICHAVRITVSRSRHPTMLLLGHPTFATTDFRPTFFVDVTNVWYAKIEALAAYRQILDRDYMSEEYLRVKSRWWAQVAGRERGLCEAFEIGLWRPAPA